MTRSLGWTSMVVLMLAVPSVTAAQAADTVYVGATHSSTAAGLLELVFPTAGYAYGGDWTRGFLPNAFRIGAAIGMGVTADGPDDDPCADDDMCYVFSVAVIATTVWAIVGSVHTAQDYNRRIRDVSSSLVFEPAPHGGVSLGMRVRAP